MQMLTTTFCIPYLHFPQIIHVSISETLTNRCIFWIGNSANHGVCCNGIRGHLIHCEEKRGWIRVSNLFCGGMSVHQNQWTWQFQCSWKLFELIAQIAYTYHTFSLCLEPMHYIFLHALKSEKLMIVESILCSCQRPWSEWKPAKWPLPPSYALWFVAPTETYKGAAVCEKANSTNKLMVCGQISERSVKQDTGE